jgi:lipopolysaccharide transport system ATP-binding protein
MSTAIKIDNVSKQYRLGDIGTGTISHDVNRWWHKIRGKDDPYLKIGEENDRSTAGGSDYVWSLKNVSFEIQRGDALGIIGKNGAGKSTLLKILSRVTSPTTGKVLGKGRIASLLEVGTGFHPELTGRENIYLNGAILGMRKQEIKSKFDEIVSFSGVERYIDTPVKRYSSGMYVRLAFAVAAHLESEILIVDEVLAVGDADFQKKCLGKMGEVTNKEGRTILFVSHNMTAIKNLCDSVVYLQNGKVIQHDKTDVVINNYLSHNVNSSMLLLFGDQSTAPGNDMVKLKKIEVVPILQNPLEPISVDTSINIEVEFWNYTKEKEINLSMSLNTIMDECVFVCGSEQRILPEGLHKWIFEIPGNLLNDGVYTISMMIVGDSTPLFNYENAVTFEVNDKRGPTAWHGKWPGIVRPNLKFNFKY